MPVFTATFAAVSVSAAQDVFELTAPSTSRVRVKEIRIGQYSDFGDAAAEILSVQVIRGYTTAGSGGAAVTPSNLEPWSRAAAATVARNNTTVAQDGSAQILIADSFNIQAGWWWKGDPPDPIRGYVGSEIQLAPGAILVVRITAPADAITTNATIVFEETGLRS